jgi:NAD(P)-dependent dehydrogenase (short-subunit alcohol dehydrogenase family)
MEMKEPVVLDETIHVSRPLGECFWYVSNFSNIADWDPAVAHAESLTDGKPGTGSEFRVDMAAGFSLTYRVLEFENDRRLLMDVQSKVFSATEEILFSSDEDGKTTIRYIATFQFPTALSLLNRVRPQIMREVGLRAMEGMREALEDDFAIPEAASDSGIEGIDMEADDTTIHPSRLWQFTRCGYNRSRQNCHPISADMRERHVVITGATSGLGLACAQKLASMGAKLTLVARSATKGGQLVDELKTQSGNQDIRLELCDISLVEEVHQLADRLLNKGEPIDVLINNAGALFNEREETAEGFERSFALLLLSPYVLTERLYPLFEPARAARVINVLSGGMYSQKIQVDDLQFMHGDYTGAVAYARAKRGLQIVTQDWAHRWQKQDIIVNSIRFLPHNEEVPAHSRGGRGYHCMASCRHRSGEDQWTILDGSNGAACAYVYANSRDGGGAANIVG